MRDTRDLSIRSEAYKSIATNVSILIDKLQNGDIKKDSTKLLKNKIQKSIKLLKALEIDRLKDVDYNSLLYCLLTISEINQFPGSVTLATVKKPQIAIEVIPPNQGLKGDKGDKGDGFFHVENDIVLSEIKINSVEANGNYNFITPYTASVNIDFRPIVQQNDTPGIEGDMTGHSIYWNGQEWKDNGIWKGLNGQAGDNIELRVNNGNIQWKLTQSIIWIDLLNLDLIKGNEGDKGDKGDKGDIGIQGNRGWSSQLTLVTRLSDNALILRLNWVNGEGTPPPGNNFYLSNSGNLTDNPNAAARINGIDGQDGQDSNPALYVSSGFKNSGTRNILTSSEKELGSITVINNTGIGKVILIKGKVGLAEDSNSTEQVKLRIRTNNISGFVLAESSERVDIGGPDIGGINTNWFRPILEATDEIAAGSTFTYKLTGQNILGGNCYHTIPYMQIIGIANL